MLSAIPFCAKSALKKTVRFFCDGATQQTTSLSTRDTAGYSARCLTHAEIYTSFVRTGSP
jgi:hypothetical protein